MGSIPQMSEVGSDEEANSDDGWVYDEDGYDNAFVSVEQERLKPQDYLPTDPDHLRVWRVQNQERARERHAEDARHTRALEKKREAEDRKMQLMRVEAFKRRFFCYVRMFDMHKLRHFCKKWCDVEFTPLNRLDRSICMQECQIHLGRVGDQSREFQLKDCIASRKGNRVFPAGSPWASNTQALYAPHVNALQHRIGYEMKSFDFCTPSILAQQMRIAYVAKLWHNSPTQHDYLRRCPILFEDDPEMKTFRLEAFGLLLVLRRVMAMFHVNEPTLMLFILEQIYLAPLPDEEQDRLDPTLLGRLHDEELGTHPGCFATTPLQFLSPAKRNEFQTIYTSAYCQA